MAGYGQLIGAAAGSGLSLIGAFLGGRAGDITRERLQGIANTPGIDTGALTGQSLGDQLKYLPQSTQLAQQVSASNQTNLNAQEESALPGLAASRQAALGQIDSLFSDDASWLQGVQRRGAALGLSSGLFGSQAGQLQTLRLSDQEKMQRTQLGTGLLGSLVGGLRIANTPGVQAFLGPTPQQLITLRSQERTQKMALEAQAAGIPGMTGAFGSAFTQIGGALMGAAASGGFNDKPQTSSGEPP